MKNSIYDLDMIVELDGKFYERLSGDIKYRVIFSYDDYDYVEDSDLCHQLDECKTLSVDELENNQAFQELMQ